MKAEPAASAGVTAATATTTHPQPTTSTDPDASAARVRAILEGEGLTAPAAEEEKGEQLPQGQTHEQQSTGSVEPAEDVDAGDPSQSEKGEGETETEDAGKTGDEVTGEEEDDIEAAADDAAAQKARADALYARLGKKSSQARDRLRAAEAAEERATKAEAERDQLRTQLQGVKPIRLAPSKSNPLADVTNPQELAAAVNEFEYMLEFATLNADGVTEGTELKDSQGRPWKVSRDYSREEMAQLRLDADRVLRKAVPERVQYLELQGQFSNHARGVYPALFEEGTPEHAEYLEIQQVLPESLRFPNADLWIGDAIAGRKARERWEAEQQANANGKGANGAAKTPTKAPEELQPFLKPRAKSAPSVPSARAAAVHGGNGAKSIEQARERVQTERTEEAGVDLVTQLRNAQSANRQTALV